MTENVTKSGSSTPVTPGGNSLTLSANVRETESRAAVIEVSVQGTPTQEEWLAEYRTTNETEFNEMFAKAYGGPTATFASISQNGTKTADELYTQGPGQSPLFSNIYDFVIKQGYGGEALYNSTYGATFTLKKGETTKETITAVTAEFVVTKNDNYTITATKGADSGSTPANVTTQCKIEEYSTTAVTADSGKNSKTITANDNETVEVPAGFYYGISDNVGKVSKGFVITDSVDENGYSTGNEFVWIPVDYNSTAETLKVKGTEKEIAKLQDGSSTNYRGVLYDWSSNGTGNITYSWSSTSKNVREPAALSSYDTDSQNYLSEINLTASQFATEMQGEYNNMVASIKKYGGFYVARYEMGKGTNYSKIGVMPTSAEANDENMWYGLYDTAKKYNKTSVTSGMIWGSQYEAMLNFGLTNSSDRNKVTASTNGNHSLKKLKTGTWLGSSNQIDSINNIFDLEGNMWEWTKEAYDTDLRVARSGSFHSPSSPSDRNNLNPTNTYSTFSSVGSRISLYINV